MPQANIATTGVYIEERVSNIFVATTGVYVEEQVGASFIAAVGVYVEENLDPFFSITQPELGDLIVLGGLIVS